MAMMERYGIENMTQNSNTPKYFRYYEQYPLLVSSGPTYKHRERAAADRMPMPMEVWSGPSLRRSASQPMPDEIQTTQLA